MYSCKYKTQKEMVDNKTVSFVKMKTKIFWGIFLGFFTTFPHFLLRLAHWLLAISNQLQRWMTSAAFQRLSMTQRKTLPKALLKFITDTDHFLFHAHYLKSPIVIQKIEFDKTLADYLISVKFNPQKINQIKEKYR